MMRFRPENFAGMSRAHFVQAVRAEGVPISGGYGTLNKEPFLLNTLNSRAYRAVYGSREIAAWRDRNVCPENDQLCEHSLWLGQSILLAGKQDLEDIATAIRKVWRQADALRTA